MSLTAGAAHKAKVCSLYKRVLRNLENWYDRREVYRYYAVRMRDCFDGNKDMKDLKEARDLVNRAEEELFKNQHWHPRKCMESPGGVAYQRFVPPPDWVVDYWHPLEKAQYPKYFARREEMKKNFVKSWLKTYGEH